MSSGSSSCSPVVPEVDPGDWQTTATRLAERGKHLLETGVWSDCQFTVGLSPYTKVIISLYLVSSYHYPSDISLSQVDTRHGLSGLRGNVLRRSGGDKERNQNT